jgi:hypothetical protein
MRSPTLPPPRWEHAEVSPERNCSANGELALPLEGHNSVSPAFRLIGWIAFPRQNDEEGWHTFNSLKEHETLRDISNTGIGKDLRR